MPLAVVGMAVFEQGGASGGPRPLDEMCEPRAFRSLKTETQNVSPSVFVKGLLTLEGHLRTCLTSLKDSCGAWTLPVLFLSGGLFGGVVASLTFRARMAAIKNQARSSGGFRDASCIESRFPPHIPPVAKTSPVVALQHASSDGLPLSQVPVSSVSSLPPRPSELLYSSLTRTEQDLCRVESPLFQSSSKEQGDGTPAAWLGESVSRTVQLPSEEPSASSAGGVGASSSGKSSECQQKAGRKSDGDCQLHMVPETAANPYAVLMHEQRRNKRGWSSAFDDEDDCEGNQTGACPRPTELFTISELAQLFLLPAAALTVALGCTWTWMKKSCNLADANDVFQTAMWIKGVGAPPAAVTQQIAKRKEGCSPQD
ncbi:putative transmembrane protein [Toxoplasma gondii GAB2-2007-GAL-DOM2]|uniref:Putative transmembrane protein n=4 Tax=Toxoplasma gondii TaxID=5811 RepID=B9QIJ8_TOXGV|nr:putative transmembrane protein [Toxoplasma gondii VEG]KFG35359.1 putative transmembrane protein [Toxoplasma gondii GAB2-2007-GAL-DOM2]CEL72351.1 TPA: hypothetical protein BN1205_058270 [Toxoplasma gondii VEG]